MKDFSKKDYDIIIKFICVMDYILAVSSLVMALVIKNCGELLRTILIIHSFLLVSRAGTTSFKDKEIKQLIKDREKNPE